MATSFRERNFSPLTREQMEKLLDEAHAHIDAIEAAADHDDDVAAQIDPKMAGYSVMLSMSAAELAATRESLHALLSKVG